MSTTKKKSRPTFDQLVMRRVAYNPALARLIGLNEAILFYQLYFWSDKTARKDGWFYKSKEELEDETALTRFQQDQAKCRLKAMGYIDYKVMRANGSPTLHYRVDYGKVRNLLFQTLETSDLETLESGVSITESTQESTTETLDGPMVKELFDEFWSQYPNKKGKDKAAIAWKKKATDLSTARAIIDSLAPYKKTKLWNRENGRFIPHPSTFLNQGRYKDDLSTEEMIDDEDNGDTVSLV